MYLLFYSSYSAAVVQTCALSASVSWDLCQRVFFTSLPLADFQTIPNLGECVTWWDML